MKPSIGRIVHLRHNGRCVAAIITAVGDNDHANLTVFDFDRLPGFSPGPIAYSAMNLQGTWHWPERVE